MTRPLRRLLVVAGAAAALGGCDDETTGPELTPSTVTVSVYVDADGSGALDAGDIALGGAQISLTPSEGAALTGATDADGRAVFEDVPPGSYRVEMTGASPGGAVLATATEPRVVAPAFGAELSTEFRFVYNPGGISGVLFRDENGDDAFDAGDTPAPGIPVAVYAGSPAAGEAVAETTTDAGGAFEFAGLRPGTYTLVFSPFPTIELVGGSEQTVVVEPEASTTAAVEFTGNLLSSAAEARAAALDGQAVVLAVRGVVSWQPPYGDELFIQDETGGILVFGGAVDVSEMGLERGDTVIVVGETELRFGEPQLTDLSTLILVASGPAPEPRGTTADEINAGELQHQLVEITGATVTQVEVLSFDNQFVTLTDPAGQEFGVYADSRTGVLPDTWTVGGIYDVRGVPGYDDRFDFIHRIEVRGPEDVTAGEAPITIAEARAAAAGTEVTVAGVVIWQPAGPDGTPFSDELFVQDATGGIQVFARDSDVRDLGLVPGDVVRLTGTTEDRFGERQITATTSLVKIGEQAPPAPVAVTPAEIASGTFVHQLVTVEGATVVSVDDATVGFGNQLVTLEAPGGEEFGVYVDSRIGVVGADWTVGALVDVTGVINYDDRWGPFAHRIWVRGAADIVPGV